MSTTATCGSRSRTEQLAQGVDRGTASRTRRRRAGRARPRRPRGACRRRSSSAPNSRSGPAGPGRGVMREHVEEVVRRHVMALQLRPPQRDHRRAADEEVEVPAQVRRVQDPRRRPSRRSSRPAPRCPVPRSAGNPAAPRRGPRRATAVPRDQRGEDAAHRLLVRHVGPGGEHAPPDRSRPATVAAPGDDGPPRPTAPRGGPLGRRASGAISDPAPPNPPVIR